MAQFCDRTIGRAIGGGALGGFERLTSGASAQTWRIEYSGKYYILRRETDENPLSDALSLSVQADLIKTAQNHNISVPNIIAKLDENDGLSAGFMMEYIGGEALPHKIFKAHQDVNFYSNLTVQCAQQLSNIHSMDVENASNLVPHLSPSNMLSKMRGNYHALGGKLPIFEWAFLWLEAHCPKSINPVFLHGDFRMGNLLINDHGIAAVLDWELCHIGDAEQDLAYMAAPSWRFGRYENPVGGFGQIDDFIAQYERISGRNIDRDRFNFWLIYSALWWGIVCLMMLDSWRQGSERTIERAVIGTRVSEVEFDLVLLLEGDTQIPDAVRNWQCPPFTQDFSGAAKPSELLSALYQWDEGVIKGSSGRNLFEARVAKNALGILQRSVQYGAMFARAARQRLNEMGISEDEAAALAMTGDADCINHLRLCVLEKIAVDQPHYAAVKVAAKKWQMYSKAVT